MPRPVVEVLEGFGWSAGVSQFLRGATDVTHKRVNATFDATEEAENERMTRIVFGNLFAGFPDPLKMAQRLEVTPALLVSLMDGVAQIKAERSGIFRVRDCKPVGRVPAMFFDDILKSVKNKEISARDRLIQAVAVSVATMNYEWMNQPDVPQYAKDIAKKAVEFSMYCSPNKKTVSKVAKLLEEMIPSNNELEELEETKKESFDPGEEEFASEEKEGDETEEGEHQQNTEDEEAFNAKKAEFMDTWGDMTVSMPPLTETRKLAEAFKANKFLRDSGKRIIRLSRALTDGKIFRGSKKKRQFGTILFDNSGSMGLTPEMIEKLIIGSPGSKVAIYSGRVSSGELTVVADGGKVASARMFVSLGGNTVDGPALLWLSRQQEPRVWVSDGQVIGRGSMTGSSLKLHRDVSQIRKKHRIKWLDTRQYGRSGRVVEPVIEALSRGVIKDGGDTAVGAWR